MRLAGALALGLLAAGAFADRIIQVPNALKLRYRQIRAEYRFEPSRPLNNDVFLGFGFTREIEGELQLVRREGREDRLTGHVALQLIVPITDAAPGIAVGVQDIGNETPEGRMPYLVFTQRFGLDGQYNSRTGLDLTLGFGFGPKRSGVFTGVSIPFTWSFRLLAEHDLVRPTVGLEYITSQGVSVRGMWNEQGVRLGARYAVRF